MPGSCSSNFGSERGGDAPQAKKRSRQIQILDFAPLQDLGASLSIPNLRGLHPALRGIVEREGGDELGPNGSGTWNIDVLQTFDDIEVNGGVRLGRAGTTTARQIRAAAAKAKAAGQCMK